jgi:SAM-dependent methyltransferase
MSGTQDDQYADRLAGLSGASWKRIVDVQAPYRRNLRRQQLGRTLDIGCGIGRNLGTLGEGSVGVDHNAKCIEIARARGHVALTADEWESSPLNEPASFDALLLAHVVEHMPRQQARELLESYLPVLRPGGRVFFICPQERGYASDATHVEFTTGDDLAALARSVGLVPETPRSFPLPRWAGRFFTYNEFTLLAHKPQGG